MTTPEPDLKAAIDELEQWFRAWTNEGQTGVDRNSASGEMAYALILAGRMELDDDGNADWPAPPDPNAEYDAAVDALVRKVREWTSKLYGEISEVSEVFAARRKRDEARDA